MHHLCKLFAADYTHQADMDVSQENYPSNKKNLKKRIDFYNKHVLKPLTFWKNVLWTDKSMIRLKYNYGRMYVWRRQKDFSSYKYAKH